MFLNKHIYYLHMSGEIKCVLHGSFRKDYDKIQETAEILKWAGVDVLAPNLSPIIGEKNGFAILADDQSTSPVETELLYLKHLNLLGQNGFSYFINPDNTLGTTASYEFGISQTLGNRFLFTNETEDHPVFIPSNSIWQPEQLANYIKRYQSIPPRIITKEQQIAFNLERRLTNLPEVAVGAILLNMGKRYKKGQEIEIILPQTHKWGGLFSVFGGRIGENENLNEGLLRQVLEQTDLKGYVSSPVCAFHKSKTQDMYFIEEIERFYVDSIVCVGSSNARLDDKAQGFVSMPPTIALRDLPIEPNARFAIEQLLRTEDYKKLMAA